MNLLLEAGLISSAHTAFFPWEKFCLPRTSSPLQQSALCGTMQYIGMQKCDCEVEYLMSEVPSVCIWDNLKVPQGLELQIWITLRCLAPLPSDSHWVSSNSTLHVKHETLYCD